jgi:undecaprenyl-diphosphatase
MLEFFKIFILSLIESITEFLPVSSTTHLLVADKFLQSNLTKNAFFLIFIQLGSLCALFSYYRNDIKKIIVETYKLKKEGYIPFFNLLNSFIVSAVLALFIKKNIHNQNFIYTIYTLMGVGLIMILLQKKQSRGAIESIVGISSVRAFIIGVAQAFSVFPGVSRLGITMIAGIALNIEKKNAIRFSFLLGLPTMLVGSVYEFIKVIMSNGEIYLIQSITAFFITFALSLCFIKILISILISINIKYFGYYRIIIGTILLFLIKYGLF